LKTKSYEYFIQIFSERYTREQAEKIARLAVNILEPLARKDEEKVKREMEAYLNES
jgi:hypothetical protein